MNNGNLKTFQKKENLKRVRIAVCLSLCVLGLSCAVLLLGNTFYPPMQVLRVLFGEDIQGLTFALWQVRLPRLLTGLLVGFLFGVSGIVFQSLLKNPLASPDIIGISSSASLATALMTLVFAAPWFLTSVISVLSALLIGCSMYLLSTLKGFSLNKLILIGIGFQALFRACTSYLLLKSATHDLGTILRFMSGSLNGVQLSQAGLLFCFSMPILLLFLPFLKSLGILELGDEIATELGLHVYRTRLFLLFCSIILVAFGTAVTGPIACITFLSGPIATRLVGERSKAVLHSGLVGIILVLASDIVGQFLLESRFPVGIISGLLGAPYFIFLLLKLNKNGGI